MQLNSESQILKVFFDMNQVFEKRQKQKTVDISGCHNFWQRKNFAKAVMQVSFQQPVLSIEITTSLSNNKFSEKIKLKKKVKMVLQKKVMF